MICPSARAFSLARGCMNDVMRFWESTGFVDEDQSVLAVGMREEVWYNLIVGGLIGRVLWICVGRFTGYNKYYFMEKCSL